MALKRRRRELAEPDQAPAGATNGDIAVTPTLGAALGAVLVRDGLVTDEQLAAAEEIQRRSGCWLGQALLDLDTIDDVVLCKVVAVEAGLPVREAGSLTPAPDASALVPEAMARALHVLPLAAEAGTLTVAVADALDEVVRAQLATLAAGPVELVVAPVGDIRRGVEAAYRAIGQVDRHVRSFESEHRPARTNAGPLHGTALDAPVVQVVNLVVTQALRDRASDVHIEPQDERVRIRFRVDGAMQEVLSLPVEMGPALVSRLKIMADMNIVETRRPQDGQFELEVDGRALDVRIATAPTIWGEKAVLRLLDRGRSLLSLQQLGMHPSTHERFATAVHSPYGMVICSGPTGSGKTTTLYATLAEINRTEVNVMTIEDPVEYVFPEANQLQISEQSGLTFASGLRSILRQDPDIILVGEIRDAETARIAVQSALTGHLVLSSLHATDASSALVRLLDMGVESFLIASAVVGIVGQRLVRRMCRSCMEPYAPNPRELHFYTASGGAAKETFYRGVGCAACNHTGYRDRVGVYELLSVSEEIRQLIVQSPTPSQLRQVAMRQGLRPLRYEGARLVEEDVTTIAEVVRSIYIV